MAYRGIGLVVWLAACGGSTVTVGGGDGGPHPHDGGGRVPDSTANPADAHIDAQAFDARPFLAHVGDLSVSEATVYGHPELGHGGLIAIDFAHTTGGPTPIQEVDDRDPSGAGCVGRLWLAADVAGHGLDEGPIGIAGTASPIPECNFVAGRGYLCIGPSGTGMTTIETGGTLAAGTARVTVAGAIFTSLDVGRYLELDGDAAHAANDGAFPIVAFVSSTTIVVANAAAQAVATPFDATYRIVAGAGPVPNGPPFTNVTDSVTFTLVPGGSMDFPGFTRPFTPLHGVGAFTPISGLDAVPMNGDPVTIGCASGCSGWRLRVAIDTTDGDTSGLGDTVMPPAIHAVAQIRCEVDLFGASSVDIPANIMALVHGALPTRLRTTVTMANADGWGDESHLVMMWLGRTIVGYSSP